MLLVCGKLGAKFAICLPGHYEVNQLNDIQMTYKLTVCIVAPEANYANRVMCQQNLCDAIYMLQFSNLKAIISIKMRRIQQTIMISYIAIQKT